MVGGGHFLVRESWRVASRASHVKTMVGEQRSLGWVKAGLSIPYEFRICCNGIGSFRSKRSHLDDLRGQPSAAPAHDPPCPKCG